MQFFSETTSDGVVERSFTLGDVPGVLWSPVSAEAGAPVILMGHGGSLHKRAPGLVSRAVGLVASCGFHAVAIDMPGHGERPRDAADRALVEAMHAARRAGESIVPFVTELNRSIAERAVPQWRAVMDALQASPEFGASTPFGYTGMTLATAVGVPLAVADARIRAAVFGGFWGVPWLLAVAARVTIPLEFIQPWDDAELDRESGIALFDALGSAQKLMRAHSGDHRHVPTWLADDSNRFLVRELRGAAG
ncbi:MAG: alpha/beta hydrolase [Microbacteriaceae bacterium]|nr:alpha/beta hydrolase [Microbacteriaceae bacterium]MCL2794885.1 alpha/beta hydrolase [Microbacteriaceae bacterium]